MLSGYVLALLDTPGTVHHVALSQGDDMVRTYVDGVLVETRPIEFVEDET